ncbi:MAG: PHP domain-containing protein [Peptococcaceae bacterium]|nr:PHP domain-containing protein [Peptococcaceae bacterium]
MWQQKIAAAYEKVTGVADLPDWLSQVVWQKVELHKKSKLCRVVYQRQVVFRPEELQQLEMVFHSLLPSGIQIEIVKDEAIMEMEPKQEQSSEPQAAEETEKLLSKEAVLAEALAALYEAKPKAKLWLLSCEYTWQEENQLQISFPSQVAKDTCGKLQVGVFLENDLSSRLDCHCQVKLCYEQELQTSIMAAAEKREEKIIASALTAQKVSWGYSGPIYGKFIYDSPIAISAVFDREDFCVVRGEILAVAESSLKSGKTVYLLTIYDDTGYLPLKISAGKDKEFFPEHLVPGQWIKCRGKYGMDRFSGEVLFSVFDVEGISHPVWGSDLADEKRVELALHTKASSFASVIAVEQGVYTAAKWGQHSIGVADRHSVAAFPGLWHACQDYGLKPIYGMELMVLAAEQPIGTVLLWAKDRQGIPILYELLSLAKQHGPGRQEGVNFPDLCDVLHQTDGRQHVFCGLLATDFTYEAWQSYWQGLIDYLVVEPVEQGLQQQQKVLLQWAREQELGLLATDAAASCSDRQGEIVRFLRENGGKTGGGPIRKITSTDSFLKTFYYLGEDMAKQLVIEGPETLYQAVETFTPVAGQALAYPANEDFWQTVLAASKQKYDGLIPQEVLDRLEAERTLLVEKGYYWLYPVLLQLKERYGGLFLQDHLLTSYVLGLSRENPLSHFIYCQDCGFSGTGAGFLCPNCGRPVKEFGMGTATEDLLAPEALQKIYLCGLPENKELLWQDLAVLLVDCQLMAPGVYRRLSWDSVEAMAELFLSGEKREELPGERQWFAAVCQGMLLGVDRDDDARLLIPEQGHIYEITPVLTAEGCFYTYYPEEILSDFVLSLHYQAAAQQQLFWDIYRLLPDYRQVEVMQARDWSDGAVWHMLKKHYWQGVPYLEQFAASGEISSVEDFVRAVAHSIGMLSGAPDDFRDDNSLSSEEVVAVTDEQVDKSEAAVSAETAAFQSVEGLLQQFGEEIGLTWDICRMKAYSPEVFYTVVLNNLADRSSFRDMWQEKTAPIGVLGQIITEMKEQGIGVLPIDVNGSEQHKFILTEQGILASLDSTAAFDQDLIKQIAVHRKQERFSSQRDFFHRLSISPHLQHLFLTEHLLGELPEDSQTSLF